MSDPSSTGEHAERDDQERQPEETATEEPEPGRMTPEAPEAIEPPSVPPTPADLETQDESECDTQQPEETETLPEPRTPANLPADPPAETVPATPEVPEREPEAVLEVAPEAVAEVPEREPEAVPAPEPEAAPEEANEHVDTEESGERGASVSSSGGGDLEQLQEACQDSEREHKEMLASIDRVMLELRESETQLMQLVVENAEYVEATEARCREAERVEAMNQVQVLELEDELLRLEQEAVLSASEERQLVNGHTSLQSQVERLEKRIADEELLSSKQSYREAVDLLHEREGRLRDLEDKVLTVDDLIEDQTRALEKLRLEHSGLTEMREVSCCSAEDELRESRKLADQLERTLSRVLQRRDEARARHGGVRSAVASMDENITVLQEEKQALGDRLKEATAVRNAAEESLDAYIEQVIGGSGSEMRLGKINEVMMLLKGKAVNLGSDHAFVGEVHSSYHDDALGGFVTGFGYVRSYVVAAHGEQRAGARWVVDETKEPTYDEVENLLTAIKQMIVCYDLMQARTKREMLDTREVIRNGGNLVFLADICSLKYYELVEEQRLKQIEEDTIRQRRIRRSIAPKLPKPGYTSYGPASPSAGRQKTGLPVPHARDTA